MNQESDKRTHPRYEVQGVGGRLRYDMNARVLNLSVDGMALETTSWLHVGKDYHLKVGSGDDYIGLTGRVVWCHLIGSRSRSGDGGGPVYQAGVHFGEALTEQARRILSFVRRAGVVGVASRVFGRFKVRKEESVDVAFEHEFELRRLSLAGMLLEADLLPEVGSRFTLELDTPAGRFAPTVVVRSLEQSFSPGGEPTTRIGVEFLQLGEDDRALLQRLIDEHIDDGEETADRPAVEGSDGD
jgi:hypothetical protein